MIQQGAMNLAYSNFDHQRYNRALSKLGDAEKHSTLTPELKAEIAFLRARCYEGLKRPSDVLGTYRYIAENFPSTVYGYQARERIGSLEAHPVQLTETSPQK